MIKTLVQTTLVLVGGVYMLNLVIRSIVAPEEQEPGAVPLGLPIEMLNKAIEDFILVRDIIRDFLVE